MKLQLIALAAAAALASGAGAASAAGQHATSNDSASMQTTPKDNLALTRSERRIVWRDISRQANKETAPANFTAKVGATVPDDLSIQPMPSQVTSRVSALKAYDYALLPKELLIVNPTDKKVVNVIRHRA
jgi:Protein of unknown function (DUF1236)